MNVSLKELEVIALNRVEYPVPVQKSLTKILVECVRSKYPESEDKYKQLMINCGWDLTYTVSVT